MHSIAHNLLESYPWYVIIVHFMHGILDRWFWVFLTCLINSIGVIFLIFGYFHCSIVIKILIDISKCCTDRTLTEKHYICGKYSLISILAIYFTYTLDS